ncbi:MAG: hypothetical protein HYX48_00195 [Chlamydiales bacterium]|nr:hypothetical protein [Chlamydiales bacterium]
MFVGQLHQVKVEELLYWGVRLLWAAAAVLFLGIYLFFKLSSSDFEWSGAQADPGRGQGVAGYESIGGGPLSLNASRSSQFIPRLGSELLLLGRNTRPDAHQTETLMLLGSKATGEEKCVKVGEIVYLSELDKEKDGKRGLRFSGDAASIWVKPIAMNRHSVTFEVYRFLQDEQKEERSQLVLSPVDEIQRKRSISLSQKDETPYAKAAKEARHWGKDRLLEVYGGDEYRRLREKEKVQFGQDEAGSVFFVSSGDLLAWDEGRWNKVSSISEVSSSQPLVQIKSASPRGVEAELWDETGFFNLPLKISPPSGGSKSPGKETPLFSAIRLRNGTQVSCIAGKRRMVLREGDWLLKTASGWRNLKKAEQIEDCIHHKLQGELFIFDGLETAAGKTLLKGHLFDPMRSQMQVVSFPVSPDKKTTKSKERRGRR